jgi:hypothetical protein
VFSFFLCRKKNIFFAIICVCLCVLNIRLGLINIFDDSNGWIPNNVSFERWQMLWLIIVFILLLLSLHPCQPPSYTPIFDVIYFTWFHHHHYLADTTLSLRLLVSSCDLYVLFFLFFCCYRGFTGVYVWIVCLLWFFF